MEHPAAGAWTGYQPKPVGSEDAVHDACGVCGLYVPGEDVARNTYFALYALQHRGQESAGIAVSDGHELRCFKQMGLLSQIFTEDTLAQLPGYLSVGHTRYSTTGSSVVYNAQPLLTQSELGTFALAHNGNLVNTEALRIELPPEVGAATDSDSDVMARMLGSLPQGDMEERIANVMQRCIGAFSIVLATETQLFGFRDPWGIRPLCVGRYGDGWMLASESCALSTVGAEFVREVEPGEIIIIDGRGMRSRKITTEHKPANCIFEYIYFSRPDTAYAGHELYLARYRARVPRRGRRGHRRARQRHCRGDRFRRRVRLAVHRGLDEEPLHRAHVHLARSEHARARRQTEVQSAARKLERQASRARGRLHRARHDDAAAGRALAPFGRGGGARPHHLSADAPSVLPGRRHCDVRAAHRCQSQRS